MRRLVLLVAVFVVAGTVPATAAEADAALLAAIKAGDVAAVRVALIDGADAEAAETDGTTPLHWAVLADDPAIVSLLLEAGADASARNRYQVPPIALAAVNGNAAITQLLLEAGADPNATLAQGETVLMTAARTGAPDVVRRLLDAGADANAAESWRGALQALRVPADRRGSSPASLRSARGRSCRSSGRSCLPRYRRRRRSL